MSTKQWGVQLRSGCALALDLEEKEDEEEEPKGEAAEEEKEVKQDAAPCGDAQLALQKCPKQTEAELRQQSIALIVRSLIGDAESAPAAKRPQAESPVKQQDPAERFSATCKRLAFIRETAARAADDAVVRVGPGSVPDILSCFRDLARQSISAVHLRSSGLGRELNEKFWRRHGNEDVATLCRKLLESWKAVIARRNRGETHADAVAAERAAAKRRRDEGRDDKDSMVQQEAQGSEGVEPSKDAASASRVAEAVETAAWSKFCGTEGKTEEGSERLRAYKARVRLLGATFRRPENAELRTRALEEHISGRDLVECTEEELLSAERQAENKKLREQAMQLILIDDRVELKLYDESLECPHCGTTGAKYGVVADTGSIPHDGGSGHKRQKSKKQIQAQCSGCGELWRHNDGWHV